MTTPYRENNIEFRIASAAAIGKFKINQAHTFLQVCRKEFEFDVASREAVLLSYDRLSNWLLQVERMFLYEEKKSPTAELISDIHASFKDVLAAIELTCREHEKIFNSEITDFLAEIHSYAIVDMESIFDAKITNSCSSKAFTALAEVANDYLQHVLLAMHEFNNNVRLRGEPFLCIGDYSLLPKLPGFNSILRRADFFRKCLGQDIVFVIKNFTTEDLSHPVIMALWNLGVGAVSESKMRRESIDA